MRQTGALGHTIRRADCARLGALLGLLLVVGAAQASDAAGKVLYARGNTAAQAPNQSLRILGSGAAIAAGETISTGAESFAVLELADQSRIMLRPDTSFAVAEINQEPGRESVALSLFKGGIRALTGLIAKRRPEGFRLSGAVATIGIRGTDFTARLCAEDCAAEAGGFNRLATPVPQVVGRALAVVNRIDVGTAAGGERALARGGPLYVGDTVTAAPGGYAVLAFLDHTRITLQPGSQFLVEDYRLAPDNPANEAAVFRLLRGGLRLATGLMAKRRQASFQIGTAIATIGIRGTGVDLIEATTCGGKAAASGKPGLTTHVWEGAVLLTESNAEVSEGETVCLLEPGGEVTRGQAKPELTTPRPDEVPIPDNAFGTIAQSGTEPGLHVSVVDGHVVLFTDAGDLDLGVGEDGYSGSLGALPVRSDNAQSLGRSDPFFSLDLGGSPDAFQDFEPSFGLECPVGS